MSRRMVMTDKGDRDHVLLCAQRKKKKETERVGGIKDRCDSIL